MLCPRCGHVLAETITRAIHVTFDDEHDAQGVVIGDGPSDEDEVTYTCDNERCGLPEVEL